MVGKGQCWSKALYSHGLPQFALTKNSHILFWVKRSAWGQDQCLNVIPTSRPNYMWPGLGRLECTIVLKHKKKAQNENTAHGILYTCTSLASFDRFPCFCWYSKILLSQTYFCYYVILCYFLFFCALLTFSLWCFLEPLQPGFTHSESFLIKVVCSSHITRSKTELQMCFFLGLSAALDLVDHTLLENLFICFFAYLTASPLGLLCWFCSSLDYACWRAPGLLYTCKAFNTI